MVQIQAYGDAGVLILPWQDFSVPLYNDGQIAVDRKESAFFLRKFGGGNCDYIADHADQGFDIIRECRLFSPAVVQTPTKTRIYRWVATMLGTNTGNDLVLATGQSLTKVNWADLCLYTCNDTGGKNITMVFFKFQEELKWPLYNVGGDMNGSN